jgi:hypothetical protein
MFGVLTKAFGFAIWMLRTLFAGPHDPSADWRISALIAGVIFEIFFSTMIGISYLLGCRLYSSSIIFGTTIAFVAAALLGLLPNTSHFELVVGKYHGEFSSYSITRRLIGALLIFLTIVGAMILFFKAVMLARQLPNNMCFSF